MTGSRAPLVSVIIPTYNGGRFVDLAIESALGQTLGDLELIVVDDGSTDDTLRRLKTHGDARIAVLEQSHQGAPAALNRGLDAARGAYIAFLDQDDLWREAKLARHAEFLEEHAEVDVTFSWSRLIDGSGREMALHTRHWRGPVGFRQLMEDYVVGNTSSIVLRRAALDATGGFDTGFPRCHDVDLLLRIARLRPNNICAIPEELTLYRRHGAQMSRDWAGMRREWEALVVKSRRLAPEDVTVVEGRARSNMSRYFACLAYEGGEYRVACRFVGEAFGHAPGAFLTDPRNWKVAAASLAARVLPRRILLGLESLAGIRRELPHSSR